MVATEVTLSEPRQEEVSINMVQHNGVPPKPIYDFFRDNELDTKALEEVFSREGELVRVFEDFGDDEFSRLSPQDLYHFFRVVFKPFNDLISPSLDSGHPNGFNRHDEYHTDPTTLRAVQLAVAAGYEDNEEFIKIAMLAGMGHDIGNVSNRKKHALVSAIMLSKIFPNLSLVQPGGIVYDIVKDHEIENVQLKIQEAVDEAYGDTEEAYEILNKKLRCPLVLADKLDLGPKRASEKALAEPKKFINEDEYFRKDLLGRTISWEKDGESFVWNVAFDPSKEFADILEGEDPFEDWVDLFFKLDKDRVHVVSQSAFALFPDVKQMIMRIYNNQHGENKEAYLITYDRERSLDEYKKEFESYIERFKSQYVNENQK